MRPGPLVPARRSPGAELAFRLQRHPGDTVYLGVEGRHDSKGTGWRQLRHSHVHVDDGGWASRPRSHLLVLQAPQALRSFGMQRHTSGEHECLAASRD